jgi:uncharacterized membrane protein YqjE
VQTDARAHAGNGAARSRDLAAELVQDAQRLVSLEIALAKQEIKHLVITNAIAVSLVGFGGLLVLLGVLVAIPSLVVVLVPWHWQAALAWAAGYVVVGIGIAFYGRARFVLKLPARTLGSLKENKEWALRKIKSTGR